MVPIQEEYQQREHEFFELNFSLGKGNPRARLVQVPP